MCVCACVVKGEVVRTTENDVENDDDGEVGRRGTLEGA